MILKGSCDASFGANEKSEDEHSSYGGVLILGGCALSWPANGHSTTLLSTAKAELMTAKKAFAQGTHFRALSEDHEIPQRNVTTIYSDNQAAYKASIVEIVFKRLKHGSPLGVCVDS